MPSPDLDLDAWDFDAWIALSTQLLERDELDQLELLAERDLALDDWRAIDKRHQDTIVADVVAGRLERPKKYGEACAAELARREREEEQTAGDEPADAAPLADEPTPLLTPEEPGDTREMKAIRREELARPALPFVAAAPNTQLLEASLSPATQDPRSGATMPLGVAMPIPGRATPFDAPKQEPPRAPPSAPRTLTVQEHAGLSAELALYPERVDEILQRWGILDPQTRVTLDAEWQQRLANPAARVEWQRAFEQYRAWLLSQRR